MQRFKHLAIGVIVSGTLLSACGTGSVVGSGAGPESSAAPERTHLTESGQPSPVVGEVRTEATLKEQLPTVASMVNAPSVTGIVEGVVTDIRWGSSDQGQVAQTEYRVRVNRDLKGSTQGEIVVTESGGYLDAATVREGIDAKFGTPSAPVTGYVDERFEGGSHPSVGDSVLIFIEPDPNKGREGSFWAAMGPFGRFTKSAGGSYVRAAARPGWEATTAVKAVEAAVAR